MVVALAICVTVSFSVIDKPIASAFGVKEGPVKEIFSIPFQQTARYIQEYPDEVASEEKEGINNLLSYDAISEKYIPERSDPVKDTYKSESTTKICWSILRYGGKCSKSILEFILRLLFIILLALLSIPSM